jgi:hypothetical protein
LDFIPEQEIVELMRDLGVTSNEDNEACVILEMDTTDVGVRHCLCADDQTCECGDGWNCRTMNADQLVASIIGTVHKIHEGQTVLVPAGRWRSMFDAVAYSMAEDEPWQEFDASATIRLNTRDPLLFESGDEHTLANLLTALMKDGESEEQSVFLIPAGAPFLMHICPCGPVKLWFGNSALADEVSEVYAT